MSLDAVLDSIADYIGAQVSEIKASEVVGGTFDLVEMKRRSAELPAAFTTLTATKDGSIQFGKLYCRGFFLAVLAVSSRAQGQAVPPDRARQIVHLLSRVMIKIADADNFGNAEITSKPARVASMNPYTATIDSNNLALWGITWEQDLELTFDDEPAELPPLTSIHADWQMVESTQPVDAEDEIDTDGP
jgi:hypothetical protein